MVDPVRFQEALKQAVGLLHDEYLARATASVSFPPDITSTHIRQAMASYEHRVSAAATRDVCSCCGKLVPTADIYRFDDVDSILQPLKGTLDQCGRHGTRWNFCSACHAALVRGTIPKFSAQNIVNVTLCQHYPAALEDLTLAEEYLIAKCHSYHRPEPYPNPKLDEIRVHLHAGTTVCTWKFPSDFQKEFGIPVPSHWDDRSLPVPEDSPNVSV
jgi:hypothetical protein